MYLLIAALILCAVFVLVGRGGVFRRLLRLRLSGLIFAALSTAAALATAFDMRWYMAAPLAALSVWQWVELLRAPAGPSPPAAPDLGAMSAERARAVLGVGPDATRKEIQAAYLKLIRAVHPDRGGSAGLAAELNAARDRLLKA